MEKILQDIWIMTDSGLILFSELSKTQIDEHLFAGLLSALTCFAEELTDQSLDNIEMESKKIYIVRHDEITFVVSTSKDTKEKKLLNELNKVISSFFELYEEKLINWNQDTTLFKNFGTYLDETLQAPVESFLSYC